jgi:hypothetical protein
MEHCIHVCTAGSAVLMMAHERKKEKTKNERKKDIDQEIEL